MTLFCIAQILALIPNETLDMTRVHMIDDLNILTVIVISRMEDLDDLKSLYIQYRATKDEDERKAIVTRMVPHAEKIVKWTAKRHCSGDSSFATNLRNETVEAHALILMEALKEAGAQRSGSASIL